MRANQYTYGEQVNQIIFINKKWKGKNARRWARVHNCVPFWLWSKLLLLDNLDLEHKKSNWNRKRRFRFCTNLLPTKLCQRLLYSSWWLSNLLSLYSRRNNWNWYHCDDLSKTHSCAGYFSEIRFVNVQNEIWPKVHFFCSLFLFLSFRFVNFLLFFFCFLFVVVIVLCKW